VADNLTSRGSRANTAARLPALPASVSTEPARRAWEEMVREWLEVRLGARGDRFERAVTFRDLDPLVAEINRRLLALENESGASIEDCCKALRAQVAALWAAIYLMRSDIDALDVLSRGRVIEVKDIVVDPGITVGDPYYANVTLLIQGGTDGDTVINDLSTYASTVTITADATFESSHQVFSNNAIRGTSIGPTIPPFTSTGAGSRFSRPSSEAVTIECWFYYTVLENFAPSGWLWAWYDSVAGRIAELGTTSNAGTMYFRINSATATNPTTLSANTLYFVQLTVSGNTYYLDVNGTQVETGTFPAHNNTGTYSFYPATGASTSSGPTNRYWASPLRVTKGVARARGSVPTEAWALTTGTTSGASGNARWYESSSYAVLSDRVGTPVGLNCMATFTSATDQVGVAHVSSPDGTNAQAARSGKVYLEFRFGSTDGNFVGVLANTGFTSGYVTTADPFGTTGYYCVTNIDYRSKSPGLITNGTASTNASYDWTATDIIGMAIDWATGKVWFSKNGTWISGDPAAGTSPTFTLGSAEYTIVGGAYTFNGGVHVLDLRARATTTAASPPTGFTWYA
jgi:hypothetical protein